MNKMLKQKIRDLLKGRKVSELNSMEIRKYLKLSAKDFIERFGEVMRKLS